MGLCFPPSSKNKIEREGAIMKTEELHNERNLFIDIGTEHSSASGK